MLRWEEARRFDWMGFGNIMPLYFLLHDARRFQQQVIPALATSWQQRSFTPCRSLCAELFPAAQSFAERYGTGPGETVLLPVTKGLSFDPDFWRLLVGEVLLFGAAEVPRLAVAPDTLCCLLARVQYGEETCPRERFAPIQQAHYGTKDLNFGGRFYRPEHAGINNPDDVARLADYLAQIDSGSWTVADLDELREASDETERAEELEYARDCLVSLRELYQEARQRNQVVVCEIL